MRETQSAIGCGVFVLIVLAGFAFLGWAMFGDNEVYVAGASKHKFAPPSAKEIDYYERQNISGIVSVTYLVGEEEFRKFAADQGWLLERRASGPIDATAISPKAWASGATSGPQPQVGECLFYEVRRGNGGGITVILDLANSRAIINKSNR